MSVRYLAGMAVLGIVLPAGDASAQTSRSEEREVTLVGCVMRESVYRDTYGPGLSGPRGPGIGVRNEYVLVEAREIPPGGPLPDDANAACSAAGSTFPSAYELTGSREEEIAEYVGKRVVLTGMQKEARVRPVGTSGSGIVRPTGGFDAAAAGLRRIRHRRVPRSLIVAACVLALPAAAAAQQAGGTDPFRIESHWLASGSLGSDFEADAEDPGVNFAGTMGWLWRGVIGGEFQANFSPDFQLDPAFTPPFLAEEPAINSYMLNVIAAAPLMAGGQFQPYFSAGAGWFTMNGDSTPGDPDIDLDHTETGWNAGFGLTGFLGQMGVRADLRYFAVGGNEFQGVDPGVLRARHGAVVDDQEGLINTNLLSGVSFWRGNVGVALRW